MSLSELQKAKEAISLSNLAEIAELAAALRSRLQILGADFRTIGFGPDPMPGSADTWEEIEADFARHEAGEKGFTLEEMRRFRRDKIT